jgi:pimeloyl-ACP methyl ester carboxylesterase
MVLPDSVGRSGTAARPAIVLVHGSVVSRKMWLPQVRGLSTPIGVGADLPGHERPGRRAVHVCGGFAVLADLIEREHSGRALVVGASLGGYVAIDLAHHFPDRVAGWC